MEKGWRRYRYDDGGKVGEKEGRGGREGIFIRGTFVASAVGSVLGDSGR